MRFVRFEFQNRTGYGLMEGESIKAVQGDIFGDYQVIDRAYPLADCRLLLPCQPSKIFGVGLNYKDLDRYKGGPSTYPPIPGVFMIPPTGLIGAGDKIVYPKGLDSALYEGELAVVIGKPAKHVKAVNALEYVFGCTCFNDVSGYELPGVFGKGTDTFSPMGPCIATGLDPSNLSIQTRINDETKQDSNSSQLIFTVPEIIEFITQYVTLLPGDVITAGSPDGVGDMVIGDTVEVSVEGVGSLKNTVVSAE